MEQHFSQPSAPAVGQLNTDLLGQPLVNKYDFDSHVDRLRFLHRCLTDPLQDFRSQTELYLRAGCEMFSAPVGFIVASVGPLFQIKMAYDHEQKLVTNELNDEQKAIFQSLLQKNNFDIVRKVMGERTNEQTPCMQNPTNSTSDDDSQNFFGLPIVLAGAPRGVLCFMKELSSSNTNKKLFDTDTLELMAEGVARMIEIQNTQEKNRVEDIRGFATSGVKTLEEYISQARQPEGYGVSGRVVEVLNRRIGQMPLSIDYVADELNLSKRTLQRRLQQQSVSFAQLRDQVRFHFSIDYLIHQSKSIDSISTALDFSDRTSFTNAFKRWTSLSPSTFRKLFRDYS